MKKTTTKSRNVSFPNQTPAGSKWLTRTEVAEALGCSVATVRRLEGSVLEPTEDADGVHRFDPVAVIHVLRDRSARAVDPSPQGERDARVFGLLDAGKGIRDIVTMLRLPVDVVIKLSDVWKELGRRDLVIPPTCRAEIEQCLGPARDAAELAQMVRSVEAERERLQVERDKLSNSIGSVIDILGELAARSSEVETVLPALKNELSAELAEALDNTVKYYQQRVASVRVGEPPGEPSMFEQPEIAEDVMQRSRP